MNTQSRNRLSGVSPIAMSMALPHENRPVRLPVTPVVHTATVSLMSDNTFVVPDTSATRAVLTRDPCYPLWMEQKCTGFSVYWEAAESVEIPGEAGENVFTYSPDDVLRGLTPGAPIISEIAGVAVTGSTALDAAGVVGVDDTGKQCLYVPLGSTLELLFTAIDGELFAASKVRVEIEVFRTGEWLRQALTLVVSGSSMLFLGTAGATTATTGTSDGDVPCGFIRLKSAWLKVGGGLPVESVFKWGWSVAGRLDSPSSDAKTLLLPAFFPPEFQNSVIPYTRTRANATAALFTNVTAVLSKEGTILASRLKSASVDFCRFSAVDINAVHPKFRYYGPLEKGLYTFTTPSANDQVLRDCFGEITSNSWIDVARRPLFHVDQVGIYNAIIFSDLGSDSHGTNLATSVYTHLEFEVVSALFTPGVSTATLETLHAAEVALVNFGHFHENPIHWAAIAAAAKKAISMVAPMVAPVAQYYGQKLLDKGVAFLRGTQKNEVRVARQMPQALAPRTPRTTRRPARKVIVQKQTRKRRAGGR